MLLPSLALFVNLLSGKLTDADFGPKYPITAALYQDRFEENLWDEALSDFAADGGNTVWLEGPPLVRRSKSDLQQDPVYKWCKSTGSNQTDCFSEAENDLAKDGIRVSAFASYQYEEDFSDAIMRCTKYDKKIVTENTYYRLVLPAREVSDPCNLSGNAVVLFTSLSGPDPHDLLLKSAKNAKFKVYFGLPRVPRSWGGQFDAMLMPAYFELVQRVLIEHKVRYSKSKENQSNHSIKPNKTKSLYDVIEGYYSSDSCNIGLVDKNSDYVNLYANLSKIMHKLTAKKLAVAPEIDLSKFGSNRTIEDHVRGLIYLAHTSVDLIAVHEGRGYGNAPYYWPTEIDLPVKLIDPVLDEILFLHHSKSWKVNGTFKDAYTGSVHELFAALGNAREYLRRKTNLTFELWLAVEAFENLKNDTCIPLPGIHRLPTAKLIDRASKSRIDQAITHGSAKVQGAMAFSWDPDFTCTTKTHRTSLTEEIKTDAGRPIIADCFLHSTENRSVVVLGYGLAGETQGFDLDWPDYHGHRHITNNVYGYYYELDYGIQHHLIGSMAYIQMFDAYDIIDLPEKGYMKIKAEGSYHECVLTYDYSTT